MARALWARVPTTNKQTRVLIGSPEEYVHGHTLSIMLTQINMEDQIVAPWPSSSRGSTRLLSATATLQALSASSVWDFLFINSIQPGFAVRHFWETKFRLEWQTRSEWSLCGTFSSSIRFNQGLPCGISGRQNSASSGKRDPSGHPGKWCRCLYRGYWRVDG